MERYNTWLNKQPSNKRSLTDYLTDILHSKGEEPLGVDLLAVLFRFIFPVISSVDIIDQGTAHLREPIQYDPEIAKTMVFFFVFFSLPSQMFFIFICFSYDLLFEFHIQ